MPQSVRCMICVASLFLVVPSARIDSVHADEPRGELAERLKEVKFDHYAEAPGYSEGPTWRKGEVYFCSGALWRVTAPGKVHKYLEINPAGTVLLANDHLLVCDNKSKALLDLAPDGKLGVVAERFEMDPLVSNIAFGGPNHDEIFCTTGDPPGVFHARVGVPGFKGHPGRPLPIVRQLNVVPLQPHVDASTLRLLAALAAGATLADKRFDDATRQELDRLTKQLTDPQVRRDATALLPTFEAAAQRYQDDRKLLAEIKRLGGKATLEVAAPNWLRALASDEGLPVFGRIVEIDLNERTDGHKAPEPKKLSDRVTDEWLRNLVGQDQLRRLTLDSPRVTDASIEVLAKLKRLRKLHLGSAQLTPAGRQRLAALLPKATITP